MDFDPSSQDRHSNGAASSSVPASDDRGLSLDDLNAAFAEMLAEGDDPYSAAVSSVGPASIEQDSLADLISDGDDEDACCPVTPLSILEAMLFVGSSAGEPLMSEQAARLMRGVGTAEIDDLLRELNERYDADGRPYRIDGDGRGYRLALRDAYQPIADKLFGRNRRARLSAGAIEILSIIAYQGPQTADEVARIRGRPSGAILSQLVRRQLLQIEQNAQDRRLNRYCTTPRFLALLGIDSLDDLPQSSDIERR